MFWFSLSHIQFHVLLQNESQYSSKWVSFIQWTLKKGWLSLDCVRLFAQLWSTQFCSIYLDIRLFFWFFRLFPSLDICLHLAFSRSWGRFSKVLWLEKLEILLYLLNFTHSRPCKSWFLHTLEVVKANFYNI